ncbi:MAG: alpha/beta hydrolase [Rhodoferax sp.]|uniref:alpha/beta fold hydrolase n=1 Tax=Rhodoferax sp. TaxID=50421 RepID=UPI00326692C0
MATANINGIDISYSVRGTGFPLLLIHGIGLNASQWEAEGFLEKLSRKNKVIAYDCRGHGNSGKPRSYTLKDHVSDALGLVDFLGIEKFSLLGCSMGSYIAQAVALDTPERIEKLILVVTKSNGLTSSLKRLMTQHADAFAKLDDKGKSDFLNGLVFNNHEAMKKYPDFLKSSLTPIEMEAANTALEGFDFRPQLKRVTAKSLVVSGKHDGLNPPGEGRMCAEGIANSKFVEMEHSGHVPQIEEPDLFFKIVDEFLSETET